MHRFFCPHIPAQQTAATLTDAQEIHHLKNVLRLKSGDTVTLFDGKGREALGIIQTIQSDGVAVQIQNIKTPAAENAISIALACAIPKNAKFEWIIEKTTELGVTEIIPLQTQRSEVRLKSEKADKKNARYQTVALNAAKQSQRADLPIVQKVSKLSDVLKTLDKNTLALIPHLTGRRETLPQVFKKLKNHKRILFFIGPEGDFAPEEIDQAIKAGCLPVSLGATVLKVDTAAISAVSFARLFLSSDR